MVKKYPVTSSTGQVVGYVTKKQIESNKKIISSGKSRAKQEEEKRLAQEQQPQTMTATTNTPVANTRITNISDLDVNKQVTKNTIPPNNMSIGKNNNSFFTDFGNKTSYFYSATPEARKQESFRQRVNRINEYERQVNKRIERSSEAFRIVPGLKGDNYIQTFARETLAIPVRATIGTAEKIVVGTQKVIAGVEGFTYSKSNRSNVKKELISAGKQVPSVVAKSYDPRKPSGLANIVGTGVAVYLMGSAKANYRNIAPKKSSFKPPRVTTKNSKGYIYSTEKGSYTSVSGKTISYKVSSKIKSSTGKGSYNLYLKSGAKNIKTVKGGSIQVKATETSPNSFSGITTYKPSRISRSTTQKSDVYTNIKNQPLIKNSKTTYTKTDIINSQIRGRFKSDSQTIRTSKVTASGSIKNKVTIKTPIGDKTIGRFVPSKTVETGLKQSISYKVGLGEKLKLGLKKGLLEASKPDKNVYSMADAGVIRSGLTIGESLIGELSRPQPFVKPSTSSVVKPSSSISFSIPKTPFVSTPGIISASISKNLVVPVNPVFSGSKYKSSTKPVVVPSSQPMSVGDYFNIPIGKSSSNSVVEPVVEPVVVSSSEAGFSFTDKTSTVTESYFNSSDVYISPKASPSFFIFPPVIPSISIGGGVGSSFKFDFPKPLSIQKKSYTPSFTSASYNIKGKRSKIGEISGLGLRPISKF